MDMREEVLDEEFDMMLGDIGRISKTSVALAKVQKKIINYRNRLKLSVKSFLEMRSRPQEEIKPFETKLLAYVKKSFLKRQEILQKEGKIEGACNKEPPMPEGSRRRGTRGRKKKDLVLPGAEGSFFPNPELLVAILCKMDSYVETAWDVGSRHLKHIVEYYPRVMNVGAAVDGDTSSVKQALNEFQRHLVSFTSLIQKFRYEGQITRRGGSPRARSLFCAPKLDCNIPDVCPVQLITGNVLDRIKTADKKYRQARKTFMKMIAEEIKQNYEETCLPQYKYLFSDDDAELYLNRAIEIALTKKRGETDEATLKQLRRTEAKRCAEVGLWATETSFKDYVTENDDFLSEHFRAKDVNDDNIGQALDSSSASSSPVINVEDLEMAQDNNSSSPSSSPVIIAENLEMRDTDKPQASGIPEEENEDAPVNKIPTSADTFESISLAFYQSQGLEKSGSDESLYSPPWTSSRAPGPSISQTLPPARRKTGAETSDTERNMAKGKKKTARQSVSTAPHLRRVSQGYKHPVPKFLREACDTELILSKRLRSEVP